MMQPVPSACPFCSHPKCEPFEIDRDMWAVMCDACQCIGPLGICPVDAVEQWNMRLQAQLDAARILNRYRYNSPTKPS
jgi:hypothetical protein